jgi:hypothetical protein
MMSGGSDSLLRTHRDLTSKLSEYNNKAGENRDQANHGVNDGVDLQHHVIAASVSC